MDLNEVLEKFGAKEETKVSDFYDGLIKRGEPADNGIYIAKVKGKGIYAIAVKPDSENPGVMLDIPGLKVQLPQANQLYIVKQTEVGKEPKDYFFLSLQAPDKKCFVDYTEGVLTTYSHRQPDCEDRLKDIISLMDSKHSEAQKEFN